ncbi:MAG: electron transfer flavoprotein subunit alpha/FixB family protein, partial [Actinomycetota bacterium]
MALNNVWVFAQGNNGTPTSFTAELLTKARSLSDNVSAFVAGDGAGLAAALGKFGAKKVYSTGDLGGRLVGVAAASAMKSLIDGGNKPDLILFPQNYDGRDTLARLSVKLGVTVLTNNIDIAVNGNEVVATTPIFGGNVLF